MLKLISYIFCIGVRVLILFPGIHFLGISGFPLGEIDFRGHPHVEISVAHELVLARQHHFWIEIVGIPVVFKRDLAVSRYNYVLNMLSLLQAAGTLSPANIEAANAWLGDPPDITSSK